LVRGDTSIDRVEALARIGDEVGLLSHLDVSGVRAEAASRARLEAKIEFQAACDRFLVLQPSLDESWWKLWGGLDGPSGAIVDKVLNEIADRLPALPDGSRGESSWRKATALVESMISDQRPPAQVTVFVDAQEAAPTSGSAGVRLEAGPKVGIQAIASVLCDAVTEVIVRRDDGRYMEYGRKSRTAPPGLKKALFDKHLHMCAADGCDSRSRLEAHHVIPWAEGGSTNEENMTLLCWFHHHVVVHERGYRIARHPDHGRVRFDSPNRPT
ncbi:MAG: HNH endonuclease, partial [Acidimicrobiia bacterium]